MQTKDKPTRAVESLDPRAIWITKYALTKGGPALASTIATAAERKGDYVYLTIRGGQGRLQLVRNEWHHTEAQAKQRVREMIHAKLKSHTKAISKLQTLLKENDG